MLQEPEPLLRTLDQDSLAALLTSLQTTARGRQLEAYRPYPKQAQFHELGATMRERLLAAGNQDGKTFCAGAELAYHLTGRYPPWWRGRRWDRPIVAWASGETGEATRDNPQRVLIGSPGDEGSGMLPRSTLGLGHGQYGLATGVSALYDFIRVRHFNKRGKEDGWSFLRFKYYAQGQPKWQGPPVDVVWFDEEPPEDVYTEGLARTIATGGMTMMTFTPLKGMSAVARRFWMEEAGDRAKVVMTIWDAEHIEDKEAKIASFPVHQREARSMGIPTVGEGLIFPVSEEVIKVAAFPVPSYWGQIGGLDFGWTHPTAYVKLAWDRDNDVVYVVDCYKRSEALVEVHAAAIKAKGAWIPVAWPMDGNNDVAAGPQLAKQYRDQGVNMRQEHAAFPDDPLDPSRSRVSVEAGLSEMLSRMETGGLKVFDHLNGWFEEFRLYHRDGGKVVKEMDDLLSATRYALMDLRFAKTDDDEYRVRRVRDWRTA